MHNNIKQIYVYALSPAYNFRNHEQSGTAWCFTCDKDFYPSKDFITHLLEMKCPGWPDGRWWKP